MATDSDKIVNHWKDVANLMLGIWLGLSPTVLDYMDDNVPALNASIVGAAIAVLATAALLNFRKWEEWLNAALGGWLIASPFVLHYPHHSNSIQNQIVVGVLVAGLALWGALGPRLAKL